MSCSCGRNHLAGPIQTAPHPGQIVLSEVVVCENPVQLMTVLEHLPAHLKATKAASGCLCYAVTQTDDPLIWHVDAVFADEASVTAYRSRTKASPWAQATAGIRRETTPTKA